MRVVGSQVGVQRRLGQSGRDRRAGFGDPTDVSSELKSGVQASLSANSPNPAQRISLLIQINHPMLTSGRRDVKQGLWGAIWFSALDRAEQRAASPLMAHLESSDTSHSTTDDGDTFWLRGGCAGARRGCNRGEAGQVVTPNRCNRSMRRTDIIQTIVK